MFEHVWLPHLSQFVSGVSIGMHGQLRSWIVLTGKLCVEATPASKMAWISEELCIGCGICVKVMFGLHPFDTGTPCPAVLACSAARLPEVCPMRGGCRQQQAQTMSSAPKKLRESC